MLTANHTREPSPVAVYFLEGCQMAGTANKSETESGRQQKQNGVLRSGDQRKEVVRVGLVPRFKGTLLPN